MKLTSYSLPDILICTFLLLYRLSTLVWNWFVKWNWV